MKSIINLLINNGYSVKGKNYHKMFNVNKQVEVSLLPFWIILFSYDIPKYQIEKNWINIKIWIIVFNLFEIMNINNSLFEIYWSKFHSHHAHKKLKIKPSLGRLSRNRWIVSRWSINDYVVFSYDLYDNNFNVRVRFK